MAKIATQKKRKLCGECKLFLGNLLLLKFEERVPIKYFLVRNSSSINPNNMAIQAAPMSKRLSHLADLLYSLKFISSFVTGDAKFQYV